MKLLCCMNVSETSPNPYMLYPSPGGSYRTPSPMMDYTPGSQYNPICPTTSVAYPVAGPPICSPLPTLNPQMAALSPPIGQPAVGRVSPQLTYQLPHNSPIYVPDANIVEHNQARTFIDMAPMENITITPMEHITINSRDFPEFGLEDRNLSESLSMNLSLNSDANQANRMQENMTDSFTRLANNAFNEFAVE